MADVTISELAGVVGVSVDKLLSQIKEAGLSHTEADELISNDDKNTLLVFLRRSHGDRDATSAAASFSASSTAGVSEATASAAVSSISGSSSAAGSSPSAGVSIALRLT